MKHNPVARNASGGGPPLPWASHMTPPTHAGAWSTREAPHSITTSQFSKLVTCHSTLEVTCRETHRITQHEMLDVTRQKVRVTCRETQRRGRHAGVDMRCDTRSPGVDTPGSTRDATHAAPLSASPIPPKSHRLPPGQVLTGDSVQESPAPTCASRKPHTLTTRA